MPAPTFVAFDGTGHDFHSGTTQKIAGPFDVQVGDKLVAVTRTADESQTLTAPTATGVTFTEIHAGTSINYCRTRVYQATITTANAALNISGGVIAPSSNRGGCDVFQYRNADFGSTLLQEEADNTLPAASITTLGDASHLLAFVGDWNAVDGDLHGWDLINGGGPLNHTYEFFSAGYTVYTTRFVSVGAPGAKGVNMTGPAGQRGTIAVVEMAGSLPVPIVPPDYRRFPKYKLRRS